MSGGTDNLVPLPLESGEAMYRFIAELFPLCRSITGSGVCATLQAGAQRIPLTLHEVPSGTPVLDWTVPQEWHIRDAFIKNARGERLVDFRQSNLHVVSYSVPVHTTMTLSDLRPHLFSLPDYPDWIPYHTSYYTPNRRRLSNVLPVPLSGRQAPRTQGVKKNNVLHPFNTVAFVEILRRVN